jgi:hypothetical protein
MVTAIDLDENDPTTHSPREQAKSTATIRFQTSSAMCFSKNDDKTTENQ